MKRLILTAALLALNCTSADAGPLRRLFGRGGCGGCQTAARCHTTAQAGPVRQAAGGVLTAAGQAVQPPVRHQTCPDGGCWR